MPKELEIHPQSIIQQGWRTSKLGVALRIFGVAPKVGETNIRRTFGRYPADIGGHLASFQRIQLEGRDLGFGTRERWDFQLCSHVLPSVLSVHLYRVPCSVVSKVSSKKSGELMHYIYSGTTKIS